MSQAPEKRPEGGERSGHDNDLTQHHVKPLDQCIIYIDERVKTLDEDRWLFGGKLVLTRKPLRGKDEEPLWKDSTAEIGYFLSEAGPDLPIPRRLLNGHVKQIYESCGSEASRSGLWQIGDDVVCKVCPITKNATPEYATIQWVQQRKGDLDFSMPEPIHYAEIEGYTYFFMTKMPGQLLKNIWLDLPEKYRAYYAKRISEIIIALSQNRGDLLSGVDGGIMKNDRLTRKNLKDYSHEAQLKCCQEIGWESQDFRFFHASINPLTVFVEDVFKEGSIGITNWNRAGFVPHEFIPSSYYLEGRNRAGPLKCLRDWTGLMEKLMHGNMFQHWACQYQQWRESLQPTPEMGYER